MTYTVRLTDRPVHFDVADDETILDAGLRHGLTLPYGCQSGGCGSCRVRKESGHVTYRVPPTALSDAEQQAGYILMCLAQPDGDVDIELHQPAELDGIKPQRIPARVDHREMLADDVVGVWLRLPPAKEFRYLPGQYVDVLLDDGRRRSFSIAAAPRDDGLIELHLRHVPGGRFVEWVINEMPERAMWRLEGPLGAFYLREDSDRPVLLMAGGTGFAPIKAIVEQAIARGVQRPLHVYWGARTRDDLYLDSWARDIAAANPDVEYTPVLSEPDADWTGAAGFVHEALLAEHDDITAFDVYMSGPPPMIQAGKTAFTAARLDPDQLFYDSFDYAHETWPALESSGPGE